MASKRNKNKKKNKKRKSPLQRSLAKRKANQSKSQQIYLPAVLSEKEQKKIRSRAFANCKRAWTSITKSEQELERYKEQDLAAYEQWRKTEIDPMQDKLTQLHSSAKEDHELMEKVQQACFEYSLEPHEAYLLVTSKEYEQLLAEQEEREEREQREESQNFSFGSDQAEDDQDYDEGYDEDDEQCDCEACRAQRAAQGGPDDFFDSEFGQQLKKALSGMRTEAEAKKVLRRFFDQAMGGRFGSKRVEKQAFESFAYDFFNSGKFEQFIRLDSGYNEKSAEQQIVDLYRYLVKELHPDKSSLSTTITGKTAQEKDKKIQLLNELWHKTQAAYKSRSLNQLQSIRIQLEVFIKDKKDAQVSISELLVVRQDFKCINKDKRRSIKHLKKGEAWGFSTLTTKAKEAKRKESKRFYQREERQLKTQIKHLRADLNLMKKRAHHYADLDEILEQVKDTIENDLEPDFGALFGRMF